MNLVVDTSAAVSILMREPGWEALAVTLASAPRPIMSAATLLELSMAMAKFTPDGLEAASGFIAAANIKVYPVTAKHARIAAEAWQVFGKGNHKAQLNFGDCFTYALAKAMNLPLLYKGNDFAKTDIQPAN